MKAFKRILSVAAAVCCLLGCLPGCGKQSGMEDVPSQTGGSDALGRYVETEVPLPECKYVEDMVMLDDGSLRIAAIREDGAAVICTTAPGGQTWTSTWEVPETVLSGSSVDHMSLSPDGRVFCCTRTLGEANGYRFWLLERDGACRELPVTVPDLDESLGFLLLDSDFTNSGKLIAQFQYQQVRQINLETGAVGENLNELMANVTRISCVGEGVFMLDEGLVSVHMDSETRMLDNALGQQLTEALKEDGGIFWLSFWQNKEGYLFCTTREGLFSYIPGGSFTEELVSGSRSALADPSFAADTLTGTEKDSFYILGTRGSAPVLLSYAYDSETPTVSDNRLSVYSLYDNDDLRTVIVQFRRTHPGVEVSLEIGIPEDSGITEADALRTLNTQILAGDGPDMLMLDGINLDSYLEKGVLADLSGVLAQAEPTLPQVTRCYERDGKICAVPTRFLLSAMYGPSHIVSQIQDLDSLVAACQQLRAEQPEAGGILGAANPQMTAEWFYDSCCLGWMKEDGTIGEGQLTAYYAAMQQLYALDAPFQEKHPKQVAWIKPWGFGEVLSTDMEDSAYLHQYDTRISFGTLNGMYGWSRLLAADDKFPGYETALLELGGSGVFIPQQILGILATSQHPQAAESFVSFMLSAKAQKRDRNNTFPVNQEILEKELAMETRHFDWFIRHGRDGETSKNGDEFFQYVYPDAENREKLRVWIENLTTPTPTDRTIRKAILAQAGDCMVGNLTPEEAAQEALRTLNLYLAE